MSTVPLAQARQNLSGLLDRVQAGEQVVISRHGRPVARLISEPTGQVGAELWLERLRRLHQEVGDGAV
jgi:prevent-host-death family protein